MKGHYLKMYPEKIPRKKCTFHQTNSYRTTILLSNYCLNEKFYARESVYYCTANEVHEIDYTKEK